MNCPYCKLFLEIPNKQCLYPKATVCIPCSCMYLINPKHEIIKTTFYLVHDTIDYQIELNYSNPYQNDLYIKLFKPIPE